MKTLNQFFQLKPLLLCGRLLYSLRLSLWLPVLSFMQRNVKRPCVLVFRGLHATLLELAKIVCLYTATKNADIFQAVPIEITVAMTLSALVMLLTFNWLMDRQYHKLDGIKCRVDSLKAMIKSEWAVYLESEQKKLKDFQTKY
jgi:hypothetical protein